MNTVRDLDRRDTGMRRLSCILWMGPSPKTVDRRGRGDLTTETEPGVMSQASREASSNQNLDEAGLCSFPEPPGDWGLLTNTLIVDFSLLIV